MAGRFAWLLWLPPPLVRFLLDGEEVDFLAGFGKGIR
jgi:hypothetical protein